MPRVGRNQYSDRSRLAVKAVNPESAKNFKHNTVQIAKPTNFDQEHELYNLKTHSFEYYPKTRLLRLAQEYITWIFDQKRPRQPMDYWHRIGLESDAIDKINKSYPEFKELYLKGHELIDMLWGDVILGEFDVIKGDIQTIRQRASVYIKAWKEYDKEMIEFKEQIRHALEKQDELTKEEVIAWVTQGMDWIKRKEREDDTRVDADQRRPRVEDSKLEDSRVEAECGNESSTGKV